MPRYQTFLPKLRWNCPQFQDCRNTEGECSLTNDSHVFRSVMFLIVIRDILRKLYPSKGFLLSGRSRGRVYWFARKDITHPAMSFASWGETVIIVGRFILFRAASSAQGQLPGTYPNNVGSARAGYTADEYQLPGMTFICFSRASSFSGCSTSNGNLRYVWEEWVAV